MDSALWDVLLVEDEPLWQEGIRALLTDSPHYRLVGVADDYASAVSLFESKKPRLILLDWKIRGEKDGLQVGQYLLHQGVQPEHIILISSSSASSIPPHPFLHIPKNKLSDELVSLLDAICSIP